MLSLLPIPDGRNTFFKLTVFKMVEIEYSIQRRNCTHDYYDKAPFLWRKEQLDIMKTVNLSICIKPFHLANTLIREKEIQLLNWLYMKTPLLKTDIRKYFSLRNELLDTIVVDENSMNGAVKVNYTGWCCHLDKGSALGCIIFLQIMPKVNFPLGRHQSGYTQVGFNENKKAVIIKQGYFPEGTISYFVFIINPGNLIRFSSIEDMFNEHLFEAFLKKLILRRPKLEESMFSGNAVTMITYPKTAWQGQIFGWTGVATSPSSPIGRWGYAKTPDKGQDIDPSGVFLTYCLYDMQR